jgi:hypothetical protein
MATCSAITKAGARCKASAMDGYQWCFNHHPDLAKERSANARRGGRSGGKGRAHPIARAHEAREIRGELKRLAKAVEKGELDRGVGAIVGTLLNYALGALRTELKAQELDDLIPRIEALENEEEDAWAS